MTAVLLLSTTAAAQTAQPPALVGLWMSSTPWYVEAKNPKGGSEKRLQAELIELAANGTFLFKRVGVQPDGTPDSLFPANAPSSGNWHVVGDTIFDLTGPSTFTLQDQHLKLFEIRKDTTGKVVQIDTTPILDLRRLPSSKP